MIITIRSFARFKEIFGEEKEYPAFEQKTAAQMLAILSDDMGVPASTLFNEQGAVHSYIIIMLNKKRMTQAAIAEQILSDGDEIIIYPPVSGG
jgi:molybdopterin synthase sulfur carrier subunit